jgi:hypothetical protein
MRQILLAAELTNDAILYALAGSLAFLTAVALFDPKLRHAPIGKALITLDIGLAGLEAPSVLHRFFGLQVTDAGFAWYYLGTVILVGSATWWRTWLMVAAQLRGRRKRRAQAPGGPLNHPDPPVPAGRGPA